MQPFVKTIHPRGILSFAPDCKPIPLTPLNVLIGPNGSGKSNLIEVFELMKSLPVDLDGAVRVGGGVSDLFWKGESSVAAKITGGTTITTDLNVPGVELLLRYIVELSSAGQGVTVVDETIEDANRSMKGAGDWYFYYRNGRPMLRFRKRNIRLRELMDADLEDAQGDNAALALTSFDRGQSVLSQRKDPDLYPEISSLGKCLGDILIFREWSFGRYAVVRQPQPTDLPNNVLLPDLRNLALILNRIEQSSAFPRFNAALKRFLPRFQRVSTLVQGGTLQIFLHEEGLRSPIPATRLSDGTIRFIALLAILLRPDIAPLICLEEPELGLHPDALALIAELLVEASQQTQIIVTTQSDVLISALNEHAESVIVCENLGGGSTFQRLESDKLRFWMDKYQLGDIWRAGELGGNP